MKVAIFGSTGAVGRHLVRQALDRDWEVVAFARTPQKLGDLTERADVLEVTAHHLVDAMRNHNVDRLVTLVGAGVKSEGDPSSLGRSFMLTLMKLMVGDMLEDAQAHADYIRETDLDWTVVRPPRLTDGEHTGETEAGYMKLGPGSTISRADLADFMLDQVASDEWVRQSPMVTGGS